MKKYISILVFVCVIINLCSCSVSIPVEAPTEGTWYCEELKTEIDFSELERGNVKCARVYKEDNSYKIYNCEIHHGGLLTISDVESPLYSVYIKGDIQYHDDTLEIVTREDKITYTFYRID